MLANTFSNYRQCNDADATALDFSPHIVRQSFHFLFGSANPLRPIHSKDGTAIVWTTIVGA